MPRHMIFLKTKRIYCLSLLFVAALWLTACSDMEPPLISPPLISIENVVLREGLGDRPSAMFLTFVNRGGADKLIGAQSEGFGKIELHTHINEGGVMRMRRRDEIILPQGEYKFSRGGDHLMLFDQKGDIRAPITLFFAQHKPIIISDFTVEQFGIANLPAHNPHAHH